MSNFTIYLNSLSKKFLNVTSLYPKTVIAECSHIDWAVPVSPSDQSIQLWVVSHNEQINPISETFDLDFNQNC